MIQRAAPIHGSGQPPARGLGSPVLALCLTLPGRPGGGKCLRNFNLNWFLELMLTVSDRVSDLNFSVGKPPQVELDGHLKPINLPGALG